MKRHPFAASLLGMGLMAAMCVTPAPADEMTDEERKTPPPEPVSPPSPLYLNLPGETNRQFAARMKDATTPGKPSSASEGVGE